MACSVIRPENDKSCGSPAYSRIASSASVSSIASFPEYELRPNMKLDDIKNRLSGLVGSKGSDLIQACKNFDRRSTNKIPKAQFRQVLRTFCFPITAAQYNALLNEVNMNQPGKIDYIDFFTRILGGKNINIQRTSEKVPDDLPVDEVELRIKKKIKPRLYDVIRAFWLFDINKDGLIQKTELRRIIRNYCFDLSDNLFNDLWKNYDPKFTGVIKYKDFLIRLGINADRYQMYLPSDTVAQALCWSDQKAKDETDELSLEQRSRRAALENRDDPAIQGLPMEEIETTLIKRLQRRPKILKSIFNLFDYENNGQISLSDFRGVINFFVMPMSTSLFNRVLKRLELNCSDPDYKINYHDFLEKFCKPSSKAQKSCQRVPEKLDCYPVIQHIKNHVLNPDARLRSVFTKTTQNKEWQITRNELRKAIESSLDFRLTDDEFKELITILDPGNTNVINCMDFLQLFDEPCESAYVGVNSMFSRNDGIKDESKYRELHGNRLKSRLKHNLNKNILDVEKAVLVCDPHQSGFILPEKLYSILNGLCMPLTEEQFKETTSEFRLYGDSLNYKEFLDSYKKIHGEDTKKWVSTIDKLATFKSRCPPELPVDEVEEMLRECVQSRKTAMFKDFKALDVCNVGVACKDDARNVLNKFSFRFNDKQFNDLWKKFPVNKYDQLVYDQFLEQYAPSGAQPKAKTVLKGHDRTNDSFKSKPAPKPESSPDRSSNVRNNADASSSPPCEMHQKYEQCTKDEGNRKSAKPTSLSSVETSEDISKFTTDIEQLSQIKHASSVKTSQENENFAGNIEKHDGNYGHEQAKVPNDAFDVNHIATVESFSDTRLPQQVETTVDLQLKSLNQNHEFELKESSETGFNHSPSTIEQKSTHQIDIRVKSDFYRSFKNEQLAPDQEEQISDEDEFQPLDSEETQVGESQLIEPEDMLSYHDRTEKSFTEINKESYLNLTGENLIIEADSTIESKSMGQAGTSGDINERTSLAETRENLTRKLVGKTESKLNELQVIDNKYNKFNNDNNLNKIGENIMHETASRMESNPTQQVEVEDSSELMNQNDLNENVVEDEIKKKSGRSENENFHLFNSSETEINQDNMDDPKSKPFDPVFYRKSNGESELLLSTNNNYKNNMPKDFKLLKDEAVPEKKAAVKENFILSNNYNEDSSSEHSKKLVRKINSEHTFGRFSFSSENVKPVVKSEFPYSTHIINYQSEPDTLIQNNTEQLTVENTQDLIDSYEVKTGERNKESVTCESKDCLETASTIDHENADISPSSHLSPNIHKDRIRDDDDDLDNTMDSKTSWNDSAHEKNEDTFEYLENIEFNLREVIHVIKTDRNLRAFILNIIILYFPVLICDVLLWVVIVKLAHHIRRQIIANQQSEPTESLVVLQNESEEVDRPISVRFTPHKKSKRSGKDDGPVKDGGDDDFQDSSSEFLSINSKRKVWYPPS